MFALTRRLMISEQVIKIGEGNEVSTNKRIF